MEAEDAFCRKIFCIGLFWYPIADELYQVYSCDGRSEMAEGTYVQLTKDQESFHEITPGELNEPIDLSTIDAARCEGCGQVLPPNFIPPADEDWMTGICGCGEDRDSCITGLFCPCILYGRNAATLNEDPTDTSPCICHAICLGGSTALAISTAVCYGVDPDTATVLAESLFFAWWVFGLYSGMTRQTLQRKYHLKNSPCDPCMVHCCLHLCAICQEHREMKHHLSERVSSEETVVNPPAVQEMNAAEKQETAASSSSTQGNKLQLPV